MNVCGGDRRGFIFLNRDATDFYKYSLISGNAPIFTDHGRKHMFFVSKNSILSGFTSIFPKSEASMQYCTQNYATA